MLAKRTICIEWGSFILRGRKIEEGSFRSLGELALRLDDCHCWVIGGVRGSVHVVVSIVWYNQSADPQGTRGVQSF